MITKEMLDELVGDFVNCPGGSSMFEIDDKEFYTDTEYALDGIKAFVKVLKDRVKNDYQWKCLCFAEKESEGDA